MSAARVALLVPDTALAQYLGQGENLRDFVTLSFPVLEPVGARIALIAVAGQISHVACVVREARSDAVYRKFELTDLTRLDTPLAVDTVVSGLRPNQRGPLRRSGGAFGEKASEHVLRALLAYRPSLESLVTAWLRRNGSVADSAALRQRDAVADALNFTGAPELGELEVAPSEADLLVRDATHFLGWTPGSVNVKVRKFDDPEGRQLKVMITDRDPIEGGLGVDFIYYHVQRQSFVLVQYKRMVKDDRTRTWVYEADSQLDQQLRAMDPLAEGCKAPSSAEEYRLNPDPSFVKICQQSTFDLEDGSMVSGLCLPRAQVHQYLRSGRRLSYQTIRDSMSSTLFANLVALGLLGSSGAATERIRTKLKIAYGNIVFAEFSDPTGKRPDWRSSPRKKLVSTSPVAKVARPVPTSRPLSAALPPEPLF